MKLKAFESKKAKSFPSFFNSRPEKVCFSPESIIFPYLVEGLLLQLLCTSLRIQVCSPSFLNSRPEKVCIGPESIIF